MGKLQQRIEEIDKTEKIIQEAQKLSVELYIDENNLQSGTGNTMTLSDVLTPDGDNYWIMPAPFWTFTFVMQSGVLSRIDKQPLGQLVSYYPYAYTNSPVSVQAGNNDIEFVTNGKYENQSTTPVTVTVATPASILLL